MKIIFMGSAEFAWPALEALLKAGRDDIAGVVCQPARPKGREQKTSKCPVDEYATLNSLSVMTPENINTPENVKILRSLNPDLIIIVAYGQILKADILALAPKGCINLHASLLPKYRGAAPIQWAIARGEQMTGVTTMFINEKMDAGDIIAQDEEIIHADDTASSLGARLAEKGTKLLLETVEKTRSGNAQGIKQDDSSATYAPMLKKSDGLLDWNKPAKELENRIRAFQPWPVCFFILNSIRIRVLRARVEPDAGRKAGTVLEAKGEGPLIQCEKSSLRLLELQPEGKKPMHGSSFLCGNKISRGNSLRSRSMFLRLLRENSKSIVLR